MLSLKVYVPNKTQESINKLQINTELYQNKDGLTHYWQQLRQPQQLDGDDDDEARSQQCDDG